MQRDPCSKKRERALGNALEPASQMRLCYSPPKHWEQSVSPSQSSGSAGASREADARAPFMKLHAPQPTACLPLDAGDHHHHLVPFKQQGQAHQGGHRSEGHTSMPGHYSKQKASPARLCSTRAAVNETIYCTPISVQPLDHRTASAIVLSALIKAGSGRHLRPVQLGQSGSSSEEGDRESQLQSSVQNKEHLLPRRLVPTAERRMETISVPSPVLHKRCQC